MFDETLDVYPHEKTFKGRQKSTLDQQLTSTEQSQKMKAIDRNCHVLPLSLEDLLN